MLDKNRFYGGDRFSGCIAVDVIAIRTDQGKIEPVTHLRTNRYSLESFDSWRHTLELDFGAQPVQAGLWDSVLMTDNHLYICRIEGKYQCRDVNIEEIKDIIKEIP